MQPLIALLVGFIFVLYLLRSNRAAYWQRPAALWIPQIWLLIIATRSPNLWLRQGLTASAEAIEEGNPLNRNIYIILIVIAVIILATRGARCWKMVWSNPALIGLVAFAALSLFWSDFPYVGLKRWVVTLGDLAMILVVLSDKRPRQAVELIVGRCACILIPMSFVLWKYFPAYGRVYHRYSGELMITGVTVGKNNLGALAMVAFVFCFWRLLYRSQAESNSALARRTRTADLVICGMAGYILAIVNCATALYLAIVGTAFLVLGKYSLRNVRRIATIWIVAAMLATPVLLSIGSSRAKLDELQGHSQTFWGRVNFWQELMTLDRHSALFGVGFDTYWLGSRLQTLWDRYWWHPNEAHNGYVEAVLELGLVGVGLLVWFIIGALIDAAKEATGDKVGWGVLRLTFIAIAVAYNITEAAVKGTSLIWFTLLLFGSRGVVQAVLKQESPVARRETGVVADDVLQPAGLDYEFPARRPDAPRFDALFSGHQLLE